MIHRAAQFKVSVISSFRENRTHGVLLTVQNDSHQRLVVAVQDFPQCKGLLRSFRQQAEEHGDGVVRRQTLRMDEPAPSEFRFIRECETKGPCTLSPMHVNGPECVVSVKRCASPGGLRDERVSVESEAAVAVEGPRLHGHAAHAAVQMLHQPKRLHHPEP